MLTRLGNPSAHSWHWPGSMQAQHHTETIFVDEEIITFPHILYPSVEEFLENLDRIEPHRRWSRQFLIPLRKMGVWTLDDIDMATPECLYVFFKLPPIPIMDLFERVYDSIESIHRSTNTQAGGY